MSGQLPIDPATGEFAQGGIQAEARQSLTNIKNILAEAGLTMQNVVKVTVLLADISNFAAVNEVYSEFFLAPYPARSAFAVAVDDQLADYRVVACQTDCECQLAVFADFARRLRIIRYALHIGDLPAGAAGRDSEAFVGNELDSHIGLAGQARDNQLVRDVIPIYTVFPATHAKFLLQGNKYIVQ